MALVWYVAYGSNLSTERLLCYVRGGRPPGAARAYRGCLDRTPPRADRGVTLPYSLYFGGRSTVWGGGVAFVRPDGAEGGAPTLGRAWLLTEAQLGDLVAQENGGDPTGAPVDLAGPFAAAGGWYERLLACPPIEGLPAFTLTSGVVRPPTPPADAYVACMVSGLAEAHGLSESDARAYVAARAATGT